MTRVEKRRPKVKKLAIFKALRRRKMVTPAESKKPWRLLAKRRERIRKRKKKKEKRKKLVEKTPKFLFFFFLKKAFFGLNPSIKKNIIFYTTQIFIYVCVFFMFVMKTNRIKKIGKDGDL